MKRISARLVPVALASWRWLKESWSIYECQDGSRILYFNRWPHVGAVAALPVAFVVCLYGTAWFKTADFSLIPPPPPQTWHKRPLRDRGIASNDWTLYPLALSSSGGRYRFKLRLVNEGYTTAHAVCGLTVEDVQERTLASRTWPKVVIGPRYGLSPDQDFEFKAPSSADKFFVVLSGCNGHWGEQSFLVQFERN